MTQKRSDLAKTIDQAMKNPDFKAIWEAEELQYQIIDMLVKARIAENYTQEELAKLAGLRQPNLSRIETGKVMPDIPTLQRIAKALGKTLKIEFV